MARSHGEKRRQAHFERYSWSQGNAPATWSMKGLNVYPVASRKKYCAPHARGQRPLAPDAECYACRRALIAERAAVKK